MIAKKNSRLDLERKRIVFFQLGLFVMGSFTLAAFTYKAPSSTLLPKNYISQKDVVFELETNEEDQKDEVSKIQSSTTEQQSQSTVLAPILPSEIIKVSTGPQLVQTTIPLNPGDLLIGNGTILADNIIEVHEDPIDFPSVEAEFIGGYEAMRKYISDHLNIAQDPYSEPLSGKVYLCFVIEKDGSVSNVNVEQGISSKIDREAARVIRSFPNWKPGENNGKVVRTKVRLPISIVTQ